MLTLPAAVVVKFRTGEGTYELQATNLPQCLGWFPSTNHQATVIECADAPCFLYWSMSPNFFLIKFIAVLAFALFCLHHSIASYHIHTHTDK